ncbi:NAD(P)/FAD-dependent oxidoreductase [Niastella sp. OAS944]|uniref:NAD(P)/FAD-dependent oxidoreductase n=1 Tax=Niastella sp. OAS944 TaxID=2664089 RepID=UPI00349316FE|nr:protoporphyrinogen oxidase [Chitinophagaceae bacterium OAS944]
MGKQAIIIGAGPAGLTAAYELLKRTDIKPIILEKSGDIGGISKTIKYKGNRMDIGGHRFFSKSDRVMNWWLNIMPLEKTSEESVTINYQNKERKINNSASQVTGEATNPGLVMLLRKRLSRIYFLRKFFNYPIQLSIDTLRKLGLLRTIRILLSYLFAQLVPRKPEKSLEDFLINRFGRELYLLFFKDYTEKVWGVPCNEISAEWGAQRIKGVSISKAIQHAAQMMMKKKKKASGDISQKDTETSLIEQFLYPALGPGQLWEEVARQIEVLGGTILMHQNVKSIELEDDKVKSIVAVSSLTGETTTLEGDYFFSTMPVQELIAGMKGTVPTDVKEIAAGLQYRDFITVGVLLEKLSTADNQTLDLQDTWIYIQERDVKVGRLQLFNNWSPYMVNKPGTVWIGMEYFCNEGDDFWRLTDEEIKRTAVAELEKMGLAQVQHVLDSTVHRVEKTYPAYFGTYNQFDKIRAFTDQFANLFLVGRNGMHKYNNADHSMLTAMVSVDNIAAGITSKENIWEINTEQEYHEETKLLSKGKAQVVSEYHAQVTALRPAPTFFNFFSRNKANKWAFCIAWTLILVQFAVFKTLYPFANFMPDSYSYIEAAWNNYAINFWPVGYSKFLRIFSAFAQSDFPLVLFQYLFLQAAIFLFVFTLLYIIQPGKIVKYVLLGFFVLNPVFIAASNYVSADAVFTAVSLLWIVQLIWLLYKPKPYMIWAQAGLLLIAFILRYNALYYPFIGCGVLIASRLRWPAKLAGTVLAVALIGLFMWHTSNKYKELIGLKQFSTFGGWQQASNALFAYSRIAQDNDPVPDEFRGLHAIVRNHLDSLNRLNKRPDSTLGIYYLWNGPLLEYMERVYQRDTTTTYFKRKSLLAPLYAEYGRYLIKKNPAAFAKYFLLPNTINFLVPPAEFLGQYNMKSDSVGQLATRWFGYKSQKVIAYNKEVSVLKHVPQIYGIVNVAFFIGVVGFLMFYIPSKNNKIFKQITFLIIGLWLMNAFFSILASPIVLRYQMFLFIVCYSLTALQGDYLIKMARQTTPVHIKRRESSTRTNP